MLYAFQMPDEEETKGTDEQVAKRQKTEGEATVVEGKPADEQRGANADVKADEPTAKRQKTAEKTSGGATASKPADPAVIRKQVEYYLSDDNLKTDRFFHEKISSDAEGWLEMNLVLSCNKMKALKASKEDVVSALKDSKLELKEGGIAIRRPGNAPLPSLQAKPQHHQKKFLHAHDGGVVAVVKGVPAEQSWVQVKEALVAKLPPKVALWFVGEVNDKGQCSVVCQPFEGDVAFFESLELSLANTSLRTEVCYGEALQSVLKCVPKALREKREREAKKKQKERNRPIMVGSHQFVNVGAVRGKVKEITNSRSDGEQLKPEGTDFKLIKALLEFHPKGAEKTKGMVGIKVARSPQGDSRCFYMIKEDGKEEDVSLKKCIDAIELNPPYIKVEKKTADAGSKAATAATAASASGEAKAEEKAEVDGEAEGKAEASSEAETKEEAGGES